MTEVLALGSNFLSTSVYPSLGFWTLSTLNIVDQGAGKLRIKVLDSEDLEQVLPNSVGHRTPEGDSQPEGIT